MKHFAIIFNIIISIYIYIYVFKILTNSIDYGTKCSLCKFADDTKLSGLD